MALKINFKHIDDETAIKLRDFFRTQQIKFWYKYFIYKFKDGSEFFFTNDVFERQRKNIKDTDVRYEVIVDQSPIGRGAYGSVFKIKRTLAFKEQGLQLKKQGKNGKKRLVKIQQHDEDKNSLTDLNNEYELAKRTPHLAIKAPLLFNKKSYTVMDYQPGHTLRIIIEEDYKQARVLTIEQREALSLALLKALKLQVTDRAIIHCDLKPENILIDLNEPLEVNFIDYGLATDAVNLNGKGKYTPLYGSPEIAETPSMINSKADVFSIARLIALLWRVDRSEVYNKNRKIQEHDEWRKHYFSWTPEKKLEGMFKGLDVDLEKANNIRTILIKMLQDDVAQRASLDEAISSFEGIGFAVHSKVFLKSNISTKSWLSPVQNQQIINLISQLEGELTCFFYPNKKRKIEKIKGLKLLLDFAVTKPELGIDGAIKKIEEQYGLTEFRAGLISTRISTLLQDLGASPVLES